MSKIGKKSIIIPSDVKLDMGNDFLEFKGSGGVFSLKILPYIKVALDGNTLSFIPKNDSKQAKSNWGTVRALAFNAVVGVSQGFIKILEIEGVGFKAGMEGNVLVLNIGYSHPVKFFPPEGVKISVEKNAITISGVDKSLVGETAAKIRALKKAEPYKGKGIKYRGEVIRRKSGKKLAGAGK